MKLFKLPDLGEGLPDAEIREWYVKPGDTIHTDEPMVAMETAKALVDVPAPFSGTVEKLFGEVGDTIETGEPLIGFEGEAENEPEKKDSGTVVGEIKSSDEIINETATGVEATAAASDRVRATPKVRAYARRLGIDLSTIKSAGERITLEDIDAASKHVTNPDSETELNPDMQPLSNIRKAMAISMTASHQNVVPVTLTDDADIHAWKGKQDITVRIIRSVQAAIEAEPMLNASFNGKQLSYALNPSINLGLAIDTPQGLFVPVLKDIQRQSDAELREMINTFKQQAQSKSIKQDDLKGATIILSNFGSLAGRYANPIVIPPMVAIVGIGKKRDAVIADQGTPAIHPIIPISVTTDHRAITGGEVARFLAAMIANLERSEAQ